MASDADSKTSPRLKGIRTLYIQRQPGETMVYVFYDIEDSGIRNKVANVCKDYGLERIQFSGFLGSLSCNKRQELQLRLVRTLGKGVGRILLQPVCKKDFENCLEIINTLEESYAFESE